MQRRLDGPGSPGALRRSNQERLLAAVRVHGRATQAELVRHTGLAAATVSVLIRDLAGRGQVVLSPARREGRRVHEITLGGGPGLVLGLEIDHRHLRGALADGPDRILVRRELAVKPAHDAEVELGAIADLAREVMDEAGASREEVLACGLAIPAPVARPTGAIQAPTFMPRWDGVEPATVLGQRLGMPVVVDNDANAAALAEHAIGAARAHSEVLYVKVSSGLGAGLIIGGRLYRGAGGTAGELGHLTVQQDGPLCRCGGRGCLEMYASSRALVGQLRPSYANLTVETALDLAAEGDVGCRRALADLGIHLAQGLASACNMLSPSLVVIGGDLAAAGPHLLAPLTAAFARIAPMRAAQTSVVGGALGEHATLIGALLLATDHARVLAAPG